MFISTISIRREGHYSYAAPDPAKPFLATIEVHGEHSKTELRLSPEMSRRIVEIIADEVAAAGRATAEAMTAEIITGQTLLAAE